MAVEPAVDGQPDPWHLAPVARREETIARAHTPGLFVVLTESNPVNIARTNGPEGWLVKVGEGREAVGIIVDWSATDAGVWSMPFYSVLAHGYWYPVGEIDPATRDRIEALAANAPPVPDNIYG